MHVFFYLTVYLFLFYWANKYAIMSSGKSIDKQKYLTAMKKIICAKTKYENCRKLRSANK